MTGLVGYWVMTQRSALRLPFLATLALVALAAPAPSAKADLYVLESTVAAVKAGSRLGDGDRIDIPTGAQIRAVLPSGKTQTIRGPYQGTIADLAKGQPANEGVMTWIKNILLTGGATEGTPGAVRSFSRAPERITTGFSWSAVPAMIDGSVCIQSGAKLQLVRAAAGRAERVLVVDVARMDKGEVQWEAASKAAPWPDTVAARADAEYDLLIDNRPRRRVTLRVLDSLPADDDVLTELHRLGCKAQFEAWVGERIAKK